jgi:hypothetical protein
MSIEISSDVREFLKVNVANYEQLEVLLLMRREPKVWTAEEVAPQLKLPLEATADAMTHLWRVELLQARSVGIRRSGFVYAPATAEVDACVLALAETYDTNRFDVVQLMATLAIERIRDAAIHHFADAFVLKSKARKDG